MHLDPALSVAGLVVGVLVGLTGMGGGALMTPLLILLFGVPPLAAVSSDLVTSLTMKPVGALVHLRRGTVNWALVRWLAVGSVPAAFGGVLLLRALGGQDRARDQLGLLIGAVLLASLAAMLVNATVRRRRPPDADGDRVYPRRAVAIGVVGGLCVGMTSVGAGSVIMALLLLTHPGMRASRLVGTDLVQAIPLVAAATAGHVLFGAVRLPVTAALVLGAVPGTYLGARLSSRAPVRLLRPLIVTVLLASALALVKAPTFALLAASLGYLGCAGCLAAWRAATAGGRAAWRTACRVAWRSAWRVASGGRRAERSGTPAPVVLPAARAGAGRDPAGDDIPLSQVRH